MPLIINIEYGPCRVSRRAVHARARSARAVIVVKEDVKCGSCITRNDFARYRHVYFNRCVPCTVPQKLSHRSRSKVSHKNCPTNLISLFYAGL